MEEKIAKILNYFYKSDLDSEVIKLNYKLFVMSVRSLVPFENKIGCMFDEARYRAELKTLEYYFDEEDSIIKNSIYNNRPLTTEDRLIEYKLLPIIISNTDWCILINEVLKCTLTYTFNKDSILNSIVVSSFIFEFFNNEAFNSAEVIEITKRRIIEFSIKEFFSNNYDVQIKQNYLINFEKERILFLMQDTYSMEKNEKNFVTYKFLIDMMENDSELENAKVDINYPNNSSNELAAKNKEYLNNFSSYLLKLRKGIVDPSKIKMTFTNSTDYKIYIEKEIIKHPILGNCVVLSKNDKHAIVKTKTGTIRVKI